MDRIMPLGAIGAGDLAVAGGKGANLGELVRAGLSVPPGFVVTTAGYDAFVAAHDLAGRITALAEEPADGDTAAFEAASARIRALFAAGAVPGDLAAAVRAAHAALGADAVAVRSSATAEDLPGAGFAGQQDTFLHVRGPDAVLAAVLDCWASLWTARAMAYRRREGVAPGAVSLAVVVQAMVDAESSGVMFTADPATGRRDRVAISAAWGLGESVVGGTVSTDDHVVDRTSWAVVSRHVADKTEMTVPVDGGTAQRPVPAGRRRAPVLDDAAAVAPARLGVRVEEHFGAPQDVEWAREGDTFHIVQSRPVTALPEPTGDVPTTWPVPYPGGLFFRASIVEQLPDPLTPLFADLIDGSVARSLGALMAEVMGEDVLAPGDVGLPTVNGYAYYHYRPAAFRRILRRTPAAAAALFGRDARARATVGGVTGWRERSRPRYRAAVAARSGTVPATLSPAELLAAVEELLDAGTVYYTAVQSVIPQAVTSELAFRAFHDRVVRRPGEPDGVGFLLGLDSEPLRAERSLYDLATSAARDPALAAVLSGAEPAALLRALRDGTVPEGAEPAAWKAWAGRWRRHLGHYGHTVYNLDFAEPVPADDPAPLLDAVRFHLGGGGTDPRERQRRTAQRREDRTRAVRARLGPVRRAVFDRLLRAAQEFGPVREDALAEMGLAWPVMRRMLRELGRRLVRAGVLADPDEVFWLTRDEVRRAVAGERPDVAAAIAGRRAQWRGRRRAVPPQVLPESGLVHRLIRPWLPAVDRAPAGPVLTGVAAGTGSVTAPARVLDGPADFPAMRPGEVLVARITTPAWTPLFARAAAVVTDVGGPLSHGSVVAREYGIPAVLGTGSATSRIRTGQDVRVDGDAGTVTLLDGPAGGDTGGGDTAGGDGPGDGGGPDAGGTRVLLAATAAVGAAVTAARLRSRRGARGGRRSDP